MKKLFALLLTLVLLCPVIGLAEGGVTFTDMMGDTVTLDAPATKVVVLSAGECEILYAIGAGDTLVGRGEYCNYPAEVLEVPSVQSGYDTNIEQIIALEPQAVVLTTMNQTEEQVNQLKSAGIAVVQSETSTIEGVYQTIEMIGMLVGKNDEAAALIDEMKTAFADLAAKAAENESKKVYFEISPLEWGLWTGGTGTFMHEIGELMGLENIFADVEGWAEVSEEQVLERNPDVIVTTMMIMEGSPNPDEEIIGRTGWQNVSAVANKMVYMADNDSFTRPGPRLVDAAEQLYAYIYGETEAAAE